MDTEGSQREPPPGDRFPDTRWSLVDRAGHGSASARQVALDTLLRRYRRALECHVAWRFRFGPELAEEMVQGFLVRDVLERRLLSSADPARGRLRSYLLKCLDNYVLGEVRAGRAGGGTADTPDAVGVDRVGGTGPAGSGPDAFDVAWAREVLSEAVRRMKEECAAAGRDDVWGVFDARVLRPAVESEEPLAYEELVRRFGFSTPTQAWNILATAKRSFVRSLKSVIEEYAPDDAAVDEEINSLRAILATAPPHRGP